MNPLDYFGQSRPSKLERQYKQGKTSILASVVAAAVRLFVVREARLSPGDYAWGLLGGMLLVGTWGLQLFALVAAVVARTGPRYARSWAPLVVVTISILMGVIALFLLPEGARSDRFSP